MKGAATSDAGSAPRLPRLGALVPGALPNAARRLRRLARRRFAALRRRLARAHGVLRARWLRSLQLRVITTTLVISALVVTVLGFFLMQQISADQLKAKETQAASVVESGQISAEAAQGVNMRPNGRVTQDLMWSVVDEELRAKSAESDYGVAILLASGYAGPPVYRDGVTAGVVRSQIPKRLIARVDFLQKSGESPPSFTPASMNYPSSSSQAVAGLVYGVPVGSYYQLYYFFPLTQVQQNLVLIQRTLLVAGLALVFLFSAIAWLVTRWVVAPVRQAARGAQRLSTGNLDERMQVRGADELAALATSFNDMAASLQEKMSALEDLSHVQRQFVSDVSHELRTPLTTIRIAADVLFASREQLEGPVSRSAELLQSQLERFESLLTDLLEISRYDANVAVLDPEPVDVCDLVRHSADVAQQLAERRGAKIEFRLPAEPCVADVDRRRVERILRNLLVNAVEHGEGKDAVVTVAGDSAAVAVAVRDYGIGLAPGEERLVFDRFWRADPARARTSGGTGLGLAIALEDARIHGGWLEAWGETGRGSVFRLTLPRANGMELAGSPLPLGPDEAERVEVVGTVAVADEAVQASPAATVGSADGNGAAADGATPASLTNGSSAAAQRTARQARKAKDRAEASSDPAEKTSTVAATTGGTDPVSRG
jgi:two-component system sensor histidine kinase MtrB